MIRIIVVTLFVISIACAGSIGFAQPEFDAKLHLYDVMDRYHRNFDVYTDLSAAGNHFVMLARMGEDVEIKPGCKEDPYRGADCIENKFYGTGGSWGGWYLMNGVLEGEETQPKANWGDYPDAGFNLTGAKKLTFWARGKDGGERVEFFAFGVGRDPISGNPIASYPDSSPKVTICGKLVTPCYRTLTKNWQQYTIDLTGLDLSYVIGGFGWVTNAPQNNNKSIIFYLDDIRYDKSRLDEPRFLVSYELLPTDKPILKNTAYVYDNALVLLAFLANGTEDDLRRARLIADAICYAIGHDRYFTDGRLRNAYQGGDLKLFPGWRPHGKEFTVRMPGWWDTEEDKWYEDEYCVSTYTGNVAWAMIAFLSFYEKTREEKYLNSAIILGEWIENNCKDIRGEGGYTGGYKGWEKTANNPQGQTKILWKSTEHNIDVYVAFARLYRLTGDEKWKERALYAKAFVESMWDEKEGHFWTGTLEDGVTINKSNIPLDIQAWAIMALGDKYKRAMEWAENNCYVEADGFKGFDFNNDKDGIWFEGTAHMVIAYQIIGEETKANTYLRELRKAQKEAQNANGRGLVAASHDGVTTGFDWVYNARLHIGATAWFIFAELGYNPYWNIKTKAQKFMPWLHLLLGE
ncbi:conserved hypothetical protein, secreted [Candidatus Desulfofervidus auxilii]|uniref:Uncharacterized protein n=1 Tax=Desulfofervidus auxilii TaxID=1621989 RepID=A0A7U4QKS7_DESA2|nr:hypothetical protein [Candidatus Desulfofervidus auxilii]AMM41164.1 conserved hypothetical protein, secreted [Candidatus Desulfofervidus auxilii]CAD7776992.1 hypothetical protein BLFGPEAP_01588 [Candidatus Methanoperedenaceae archaeon GB50]CAD7778085.1 hypothetical protein DMNBHIDG_01675 [Candidatus Methanoperedenaceae archaeon GB37]